MGFYGNISNAGKTQISFDRIYANRRQMEEFCSSDNIFIGRKILIEYDDNTYPRRQGYIKSENINKDGLVQLYLDTEFINLYRKTVSDVEAGYGLKEYDIVMVQDENYYYYYVCEGFDEEGIAQFSLVKADSEKQTDYTINFLIDKQWAENSGIDFTNGWDSTIWEKTVRDGVQCYIMEASLNSIPPIFKLAVEPPSEKPILPHFGVQGTNLEYTLHVQPTWGFRTKEIDYNKEGFNKETQNHSDKDDVIKITQAQSGKLYITNKDDEPHKKEAADDIKELSIILPSIGNTISDVWDIVYGQERNLDINWDSVKGLRMVHEEDGSGFTYSKAELDTVAASINSVHDLMGMIIVDDINDIEMADTDKIYYGDLDGKNEKGYYIKEKTYEYEPITDEEELETYIKSIEPVELTQFEANKYYTKNNNGYALVTTSQYKEGTNYYTLGIEDIDLDGTYAPDKYFYLDEPTLNYVKDLEELPNENIQYYDIEFTPLENKFYHPGPHIENEDETFTGLFYEDEVNERIEIIDGENDPVFNPDGKYFIGKNYTFEEKYDESLNKVIVYEFAEKEYVELVEFKYDENDKVNNYYSIDENRNYICLTNIDDIDDSVEYGKIILIEKKKFYEPNLYYYKSGNNFIFSKDEFDKNASYVILTGTDEPIKNTFYEPNKYYYKDNFAIDKLDTNENMTPDREYFLKYFAYIYEDTKGVLDKGAEWNGNVKKIPEEITLAKRTEKYEWKKLEGFARTLNTIHGLIIKINNLLKLDDYKTRDNKTVQGCINVLNDIINTFATLIPGQIAIVDEYGRLASAPYKTDKWINLQVDDDVIDHKITVTHNYYPVENTSNNSDLNDGGDTINLYSPKVDEKGHVVGKNTETVTLPFGYKFFQDANNPIGKTTATNTKDTVTLSGDSWIKPTVLQGKFEYSHIGPVSKDARNIEAKTPLFGDTFEIEDWVFDDKGHKTNLSTHTVKIPQGSLEDNTHNNSDVIIQLDFTPSTGKLKSTRKNIANLLLQDYVKGTDNSNIANTDTLASALSKLQTQLNILNAGSTQEGSVAYQIAEIVNPDGGSIDKLNEIAAWIVNDTTGAAKMNADILLNSQNIASNKLLIEANAASIEVNVADIKKNADNIEANRLAIENNNTLIKANEQVIADNKSAIEENAASIKDNKEDIDNNKRAIETINNKLTEDRITKWDQAEQNVQSDWLVEDASADNFIKNKPDLTNLVRTNTNFDYTVGDTTIQMTIEGLMNYIASLEERIYNLENPVEEEIPPVE